jgi:hypothetical protein
MKKTIVCVGCSWTYGHGLSADQTYSAHLQNSLSEYNVINAGHCGSDINYAIFSAVRLVEKYNPCLVIFQLTTFDRVTFGTDGYDNFLNDLYYDGRDDNVYFETNMPNYKRVIGIADNIKTKITHGSYTAKDYDIKTELVDSKIKNTSFKDYKKFIRDRLPRGIMGKTSEIIPVIKFLSSDAAGMASGCMLTLDGGEGKSYSSV